MAQSLSKIYVHLVFHIKSTSTSIRDEDLPRLFANIGAIINASGSQVLKVGGMGDHVHALFLLSKSESISSMVDKIKCNSCNWLKQYDARYRKFAWQGGYAAFSVSQSVVNATMSYIERQPEHHAKRSFQEEYIAFLKLYGIQYDDKYVFAD